MIRHTFTLTGRPKVVFRLFGAEPSAASIESGASRSTENSRP
jgi:hypothetical protein